MLIAIKNLPHERVQLKTKNEHVVVQFKPKDVSILICCVYIPPKNSPNRWSVEAMIALINELKEFAESENCKSIILTGDINYGSTNLHLLISKEDYENVILENFCMKNLLDVFYFDQFHID